MSLENSPPTFFQLLPREIRQKIWLETFESRILSICMREHIIPAEGTYVNRWIQTFDVQQGLHVNQLSDKEARLSHALNPQFYYQDKGMFTDASRIKPARGPPALAVCRESRRIALQHYELMFRASIQTPGSPQSLRDAFNASGWTLPRTWVNPKLDLIFLSCMSRDITSVFAPVDTQMFYHHCPEEASKVHRLGVMSHNNDGSLLLMIRKYEALKELVVYLTEREHVLRPQDVDSLPNKDEAAEVIARFLLLQKNENNRYRPTRGQTSPKKPWTHEIPEVRVSSEIQWYREENGRLKLGLASRS